MSPTVPTFSLIIVSFNTKGLLRRCFDAIQDSAGDLAYEIIVVDNGSVDGSAQYVKAEFPKVVLVETGANIGFARANNLGWASARGRYAVLVNSDAFLTGRSLKTAVELMDSHPEVGLAGGRLIGEDGSWQPSARSFPGLWNDFVTITGLSAKYPRNRFFGTPDMTWADQEKDIECDWVPGAFTIIRREVIERVGFFDERYFLYSEEVDLCRRIKRAGWRIAYWPAVKTIHIGGASTGLYSAKLVSKSGKQMGLWRLQSQYLYYRKNHGLLKTWASMVIELAFNWLRLARNVKRDPQKAEEARVMLELIAEAWKHTRGGRVSPPQPWKGV